MIHPNEPWVHSVVIKSPSIVFVPALDARLFLVCKTNTPTSRTQRIPNPFVILKENIGFAGQHVAPSNTENMQRLIEPELNYVLRIHLNSTARATKRPSIAPRSRFRCLRC